MLNMKRLFLFAIGFCLCQPSLWAQATTLYNLSFHNVGFNGNTFCAEVYLSFNQSNKLGSSNLVLDFDKSVISNPTLFADNISGTPIYLPPTLTLSGEERASINIELGIPGLGDPVGIEINKRLIARICFDYPVNGQQVNLDWHVDASAGTVAYLDDETTQLSPGTLQGYSGIPVAFPVEWLAFDAVLIGTDAQLDWSTGSELNNSHFEIERSVDGILFEKIGNVSGRGSATSVQQYDFLDLQIAKSGLPYVFYRLRQIDFDGGYSLSPVVQLALSDLPVLLLEGNPNPFTRELTIRYVNSDETPFTLSILNSLGQEVWTAGMEGQKGTLPINIETWSNGVYFLSAENEANKVVQKLIKQ